MHREVLMLSYLTKGHGASCQAPILPCTCEINLCLITGTLAFIAGLIEAYVGIDASAALFSDAPHAWLDATADYSAAIMIAMRNPWLRAHNNRIFAALLAVALGFIIWDVSRRFLHGHTVDPIQALFAGSAALLIDIQRVHMFKRAEALAHSVWRKGLLRHARSDMWHGAVVVAVAAVATLTAPFLIGTSVVRYVDLVLSFALILYVGWLAVGLWRGAEHGHGKEDHHHNRA